MCGRGLICTWGLEGLHLGRHIVCVTVLERILAFQRVAVSANCWCVHCFRVGSGPEKCEDKTFRVLLSENPAFNSIEKETRNLKVDLAMKDGKMNGIHSA